MVLAPISVMPVFMASNEFLAEPTNKPRTTAAMVATRPAPSLTVSVESLLR
jgi:hypothetical protein